MIYCIHQVALEACYVAILLIIDALRGSSLICALSVCLWYRVPYNDTYVWSDLLLQGLMRYAGIVFL